MGHWNRKINGFTPERSENTTATNYTDAQIKAMYAQGDVITGADGEPMVVPSPEPTAEEVKESLRRQREPLLNAFDKWEKAVLRGREDDNDEIMAWFYDLKDLKETAFENVPKEISYYL